MSKDISKKSSTKTSKRSSSVSVYSQKKIEKSIIVSSCRSGSQSKYSSDSSGSSSSSDSSNSSSDDSSSLLDSETLPDPQEQKAEPNEEVVVSDISKSGFSHTTLNDYIKKNQQYLSVNLMI